MEFEIAIVNGVAGNSISLNEYRIAGPKPWGGGTVEKKWIINSRDIAEALRMDEKIILKNAKSWLEQ